MVTGYEATLHQTSLTDNFARLAESGGSKYTPISPDRFIRPNEIPYSVDELAALNAQDLERIGISVDEVLEKIGLEEKILLKAEKNSSFETVMGWVDGYWEAMNRSLEKRQARSHNKEDVFYADVR